MDTALWNEIISSVRPNDGSLPTPSEDRLRDHASAEDIPKLLELLRGDNVYLREIAVMPLIELVGPRVLPDIFEAYQRGLDEGRPHGTFTGALLHLPELYPSETRSVLLHLRKTGSESMCENADWLLEFCGGDEDDA